MTTDRQFIHVENTEMVFQTKRGPFHALKDIQLSVARGEFVTLIGHSGCGKSTLLNLLAGLTRPTSGVLLCDQREIAADHRREAVLPGLAAVAELAAQAGARTLVDVERGRGLGRQGEQIFGDARKQGNARSLAGGGSERRGHGRTARQRRRPYGGG